MMELARGGEIPIGGWACSDVGAAGVIKAAGSTEGAYPRNFSGDKEKYRNHSENR